jgi:deazaflavin-dependent oxidoreductase (nitroreductase family)
MRSQGNNGTRREHTPTGWYRTLLRSPILLYRVHLGWLLGHRFLLLTHTGRKSGARRQTVLEVIRYNSASCTCIVASGWGEQAQWLKNILAHPEVAVTLGTRTHQARARRLGREAAEQEFRHYAHKHPWAVKQLGRFILGSLSQGRDVDFARLAEHIPLVELQAVETAP